MTFRRTQNTGSTSGPRQPSGGGSESSAGAAAGAGGGGLWAVRNLMLQRWAEQGGKVDPSSRLAALQAASPYKELHRSMGKAVYEGVGGIHTFLGNMGQGDIGKYFRMRMVKATYPMSAGSAGSPSPINWVIAHGEHQRWKAQLFNQTATVFGQTFEPSPGFSARAGGLLGTGFKPSWRAHAQALAASGPPNAARVLAAVAAMGVGGLFGDAVQSATERRG
jgi:hypothetical protein